MWQRLALLLFFTPSVFASESWAELQARKDLEKVRSYYQQARSLAIDLEKDLKISQQENARLRKELARSQKRIEALEAQRDKQIIQLQKDSTDQLKVIQQYIQKGGQ